MEGRFLHEENKPIIFCEYFMLGYIKLRLEVKCTAGIKTYRYMTPHGYIQQQGLERIFLPLKLKIGGGGSMVIKYV